VVLAELALNDTFKHFHDMQSCLIAHHYLIMISSTSIVYLILVGLDLQSGHQILQSQLLYLDSSCFIQFAFVQ